MPLTVILAVGLDSWLLTMLRTIWQSAGYFFTSVGTIKEAIEEFRAGDFDLVLLGPSISIENRERLISLIRASGSFTPVVCLESESGNCNGFKDATLKNDHREFLANIRGQLAEKAKMQVARAGWHKGLFPDGGSDAEKAGRIADQTIDKANRNESQNHRHFRPVCTGRAAERRSIEQDLWHALKLNELMLHYQPKIDLRTGATIGAEAFTRWIHLTRGSVPPAQFIPIAEESGLILSIGAWALREACSQAKAWQNAGSDMRTVTVNISEVQLQKDDFPEALFATLSATGLDAEGLELDIPAGVLMKHPERTNCILKPIKDRGVRIAADNVDDGFIRFSGLRKVPLNKVKIEGVSIRSHGGSPESRTKVGAIIRMAQSLNLRVNAKGVETAEDLEYLWDHNCDEAQGYYLGEPIPPEKLSLGSTFPISLIGNATKKGIEGTRSTMRAGGVA